MDENSKLKKLSVIFVSLFWLMMMGWLVYSQIITQSRVTAYKPFLSKNTLISDQWLGIYFNNSPVGFVHTSIEPYMIEKGVSGYRIVNRTWMNFLLLRKRNKVWFNAQAIVDENYRLNNFQFDLNSGLHTMNVQGQMLDARSLEVSITSQGSVSKKTIKLNDERGVLIANIISPFSSFGELKVGKRYNLSVFNPFSLELESLQIRVSGKEFIEHDKKQVEAYVLKSDYRGLEQTAWVNENGEILREETGLGWVLVKGDANDVTNMYKNMEKTDLELAEMVSVASNIILPEEGLSSLSLKISGIDDDFDLKNQRQQVVLTTDGAKIITINKERVDLTKTLSIPVKEKEENSDFLLATDFIQSENDEIKNLALKIINNEKNAYLAAKKINKWIFANIRKVPVVSIPSAVDVLKTKEGDCNEHTVLFAALGRSIGIPVKVNVGLAYTGGRFYYHAWPSVYIGVWVDMDPTFGQDIADVTHIKLIEGDIDKQLDIVRLLGRIKLEVIEYK
ncbi:MAG: transglutaminase domain-containing protein [Candidatus Omnitrophota bacterium]